MSAMQYSLQWMVGGYVMCCNHADLTRLYTFSETASTVDTAVELQTANFPVLYGLQLNCSVRNIGLVIKLYAYFKIPFLVFPLTISRCFIIIFFRRYI